jgi:putative ATP-binding cassette transporter
MPRLDTVMRDALALSIPYWSSGERWQARLSLVTLVGLNLALVAATVLLTFWQRAFFNALDEKDWSAFIALLFWWHRTSDGWVPSFALIVCVVVPLTAYELYLRQGLQIRWRRWMTANHIDQWLAERTYYRLALENQGVDNPDQRIAEDIRLFVTDTLNLGLGLVRSLVALVSFVVILWTMSEPLRVFGITVDGYLVWAALLYSLLGTALTHLVGRRLIDLNYTEQRTEADLRFSLMRLRENAESVAFHDGERREERNALDRFEAIADNWRGIMRVTRRLTLVTTSVGQLALVFPFAVVAPAYFAGRMALGEVFQISSAFVQVQGALSWFVTNYAPFTAWCATVNRLARFRRAMATARGEYGGPRVSVGAADAYEARDVRLTLPDGQHLLEATELSIPRGMRVLVEGTSGSGKSTLFRAIAGLWPFGSGEVRKPEGHSLFLPQRPYFPLGSLKHAIAYPLAEDAFTDKEAVATLVDVGLPHLTQALHTVDVWERRLSAGEQQRLALARAILQRPEWLFLDEATSALDRAGEEQYRAVLQSRLPDTTVIEVTHNGRGSAAYDKRLEVHEGAVRSRRDPPVRDGDPSRA